VIPFPLNRGRVNGEETSQRSAVMKWVPSVPSNDVAARLDPGVDRGSDLGWAGEPPTVVGASGCCGASPPIRRVVSDRLQSAGSRHPPGDNCKQSALQRGRGPESLPSIC
jgi:hypothetical protein